MALQYLLRIPVMEIIACLRKKGLPCIGHYNKNEKVAHKQRRCFYTASLCFMMEVPLSSFCTNSFLFFNIVLVLVSRSFQRFLEDVELLCSLSVKYDY